MSPTEEQLNNEADFIGEDLEQNNNKKSPEDVIAQRKFKGE